VVPVSVRPAVRPRRVADDRPRPSLGTPHWNHSALVGMCETTGELGGGTGPPPKKKKLDGPELFT